MARVRVWNLDDPNQAREFLKNVWINGRKVEFIETGEGDRVYLHLPISDFYAIAWAKQLQIMQVASEMREAERMGKMQ